MLESALARLGDWAATWTPLSSGCRTGEHLPAGLRRQQSGGAAGDGRVSRPAGSAARRRARTSARRASPAVAIYRNFVCNDFPKPSFPSKLLTVSDSCCTAPCQPAERGLAPAPPATPFWEKLRSRAAGSGAGRGRVLCPAPAPPTRWIPATRLYNTFIRFLGSAC